MPCLLALIALAAPRLLIVLLWFFTPWFDGIFPGILWPILGFIFLPTTLLWYTAVQHWFGGEWTLRPVVGRRSIVSDGHVVSPRHLDWFQCRFDRAHKSPCSVIPLSTHQ